MFNLRVLHSIFILYLARIRLLHPFNKYFDFDKIYFTDLLWLWLRAAAVATGDRKAAVRWRKSQEVAEADSRRACFSRPSRVFARFPGSRRPYTDAGKPANWYSGNTKEHVVRQERIEHRENNWKNCFGGVGAGAVVPAFCVLLELAAASTQTFIGRLFCFVSMTCYFWHTILCSYNAHFVTH